MAKYLVLVKCPESETYHPYDNLLLDHDTALAITFNLNKLANDGGYYYIAAELEMDELIY